DASSRSRTSRRNHESSGNPSSSKSSAASSADRPRRNIRVCRRTAVGTVTRLAHVLLVCERMFPSMIVCVLLPRFELAVAAGGREPFAPGPLALGPEIGREPLIGESSAAAEAYGVRAGLRLGEALARCPTLRLVSPDPAGVADAWERIVGALEGI